MKNILFSTICLVLFYHSSFTQQNFWEQTNGPSGAAIYALAVNQQGHIFASESHGGIFRSTDSGQNWIKIKQLEPETYARMICINQQGYVFIVLVTNWAWQGPGIYRSTDNGSSWSNINNGINNGLANFGCMIVIDKSGNIYAGTTGNGLFRSSDNGDNWLNIGKPSSTINNIALNSKGDIFIIADWGGFYRSTDGGKNWTQVSSATIGVSLCFCIDNNDDIYFSGAKMNIYRSKDNGDNWEEVFHYSSDSEINQLYVSPNGSIFGFDGNGLMFRSIYNGNSWTNIVYYIIKVMISSICFDSKNNTFIGTRIGIFRSSNGGDDWNLQNNGLVFSDVTALSISKNGNIIAGASGFGVFRSPDNGNSWISINKDLPNGVSYIYCTKNGNIFCLARESGIYRSTNNGENWIQINKGLKELYVTSFCEGKEGLVFVGSDLGGVYRSTDNGNSWIQINNGLTNITVKALSGNQSGNIFAGTLGGGMYRSSDNGNTWVQINTGIDNPYVEKIAINQKGIIFIGTYIHTKYIDVRKMYRSSDNGDSWKTLNTGSEYNRVEALAISPKDNIYAYFLSINSSVFYSFDNGDNWYPFNNGLPKYGITSLVSNSEGCIFAGTNGYGVFRTIDTSSIDTTEFPLKVGNKWFYKYSESKEPYILFATLGRIREATEINNDGDLVMKVLTFYDDSTTIGKEIWRYINGKLILNPDSPNKEILYNSAFLKDTIIIPYSGNRTEYRVFNEAIFGKMRKCQEFYFNGNDGHSEPSWKSIKAAVGIGMYFFNSKIKYDPILFEETLIGANINGVFYGDSLSIPKDSIIIIPLDFHLCQNYPNPFNPTTKIKYSIPQNYFITIKVYDLIGNLIKTLVNQEKPAGNYEVEFNGADLSSGVYFYTIQAGSFRDTKKLILMK
ncbi:MAG: YCF48-related protein [Ignavibacteriales bacterium]|nr:YCF48-related protein [Ignavibacteriales bacterium]